jgi:hypothetical protein
MIAIHRKALATAAFAALAMFGTTVLADQPGPHGPQPYHQGTGTIEGRISFKASLLPTSFSSAACNGFSVSADDTSLTASKGTSGKMKAKLKGSTVECSYSIEDLAVGKYAAIASGSPGGCGNLRPAKKVVTIKANGVKKINFVYHAGGSTNNCTGHAAPKP